MVCGLKFDWYLRTLSLKFQKARTKIEVFNLRSSSRNCRLHLDTKSLSKILNQLTYIVIYSMYDVCTRPMYAEPIDYV